MALVLTVGNPTDVFSEPFAEQLRRTIEQCFGTQMELCSANDPWHSEELGWSGWKSLQSRAQEVVPVEEIPHLMCMPAWRGVYVHATTEPGCFQFDNDDMTVDVGSVTALDDELHRVGEALGLHTSINELNALAEKYLTNDSLIDEDMDIQTFVQLSIGVIVAKQRRQPLWIVK